MTSESNDEVAQAQAAAASADTWAPTVFDKILSGECKYYSMICVLLA
jgi:hypothetical protein